MATMALRGMRPGWGAAAAAAAPLRLVAGVGVPGGGVTPTYQLVDLSRGACLRVGMP